MDVDVADPECGGAAAEVDVPHADELVAALGFDLVMADACDVCTLKTLNAEIMPLIVPSRPRSGAIVTITER